MYSVYTDVVDDTPLIIESLFASMCPYTPTHPSMFTSPLLIYALSKVDANAPASLHAAHQAGFRRFSGYIFPCIASSPFALSREDVACPSAKQQLTDTLDFLAAHDIRVAPSGDSSGASSGESGGQEVEERPTLRRLYLDIEDEAPSYYFDPDPAVNAQFVSEFVAAAASHQVPLGFYTTTSYWSTIMADSQRYSEPAYPLWYPRWDAVDSMDFFSPFGGWGAVQTKQTAGDVALCGISQVDLDYMEEEGSAI